MNENEGQTRAAKWLQDGYVAICAAALVVMTIFFAIPSSAAQEKPETAGSEAQVAATASLTYTYEGMLSANISIPEPEPFQVKIFVDNENRTFETTGGTVEQVLEQAGVTLNPLDLVNLPMQRKMEAGNQIVVERREYRTFREVEEIPFETVEIGSSLMTPGTSRVVTAGSTGKIVTTYEQYLVDGEIITSEFVSKETESLPVTQTVMVGFEGAPISQLDFGVTFENGVPAQYENVLTGSRSTAYTATGARTASGREAAVGHVAVNPNVIPYGTKLYIQSSDGKYVYGYAIAADTGGALMSGAADVDLYYDTYQECVVHGVRTVDIYILEYPA